jgi:hypothetical protein
MLYPNPAKNALGLKIAESDHHKIDAWFVCDGNGRIASHSKYPPNSSLDIKSLVPGAYTLLLIANGEVIGIRKFVKG